MAYLKWSFPHVFFSRMSMKHLVKHYSHVLNGFKLHQATNIKFYGLLMDGLGHTFSCSPWMIGMPVCLSVCMLGNYPQVVGKCDGPAIKTYRINILPFRRLREKTICPCPLVGGHKLNKLLYENFFHILPLHGEKKESKNGKTFYGISFLTILPQLWNIIGLW